MEQRDELTRNLGTSIATTKNLIVDDTLCLGASNPVLHGAQTTEQMNPYIKEAFEALSKSLPPSAVGR